MTLPAPYFERNGVTIYRGQVEDILPCLPDGSVDLVLTDPPYVVKDRVELRGKGVAAAQQRSTTIGDQGWTYTKDWLVEAARICRKHIVAFAGFRDLADLLADRGQGELRGVFTWQKPNAPLPAWNVPHYDTQFAVWWGRGPNPPAVRELRSMVLSVPLPQAGCFASERVVDASGKAAHPSQAPLAVMAPFCRALSREGDMLLDPFAGTGTTLVAARRLGRRCIGIEREERYCAIAAQRLAQGVLDFAAGEAAG